LLVGCNRNYDFPPKKLLTSTYAWIKNVPLNTHQTMLLYFQLCTLKFLVNQASPGNHFSDRLKTLVAQNPSISLIGMGFYNGWDQEDLWK
jgi:hypothetical protein